MNYLNFFNPFLNLPLGHENPLTRAFLVLLRYEPLAQSLFLDLVRRELHTYAEPVPPLAMMDEPLTIDTQKGSIPTSSGKLVSVVLTNAYRSDLPEPTWAEREPVYDGVLSYGGWTFILEVKPEAANVYHEQLNPSAQHKAEFDLVPKTVCLVWQEFLEGLMGARERGLISGLGATFLQDFLQLIDVHYGSLAPYRRLSMCGDDPARISRRCAMLLDEIAEEFDVGHAGASPYLSMSGGIAQRAYLEVMPGGRDEEWSLRLALWPADTIAQARRFFSDVDRDAFFALADTGWEVVPNLHFSFTSTHLVWAHTRTPLERYFKLWSAGEFRPAQVSAEGPEFHRTVDALQQHEMINEVDRELLEQHFLNTRRRTMNVVPGFGVWYRWTRQDAITMDDADELKGKVIEKIREGLAPWGQVLPEIQDIGQ